jgi:hypothetical protein
MVFILQPQLKIFVILNTYSSTKPQTVQLIAPPPTQKKSSILPYIAILVPLDELVMKSYTHIQLAIVETHYHNLHINIKNQDYGS